MSTSSTDFSQRLRQQPENALDAFAETEIMSGLPFIFSNEEQLLDFQNHVANALGIADVGRDVRIVGSARTGFSLDPDRFPVPFREASDIDIVVVHTNLFDEVWRTMLTWDYLTIRNRSYQEQQWLLSRHDEVWSGWYDPSGWRFRERRGIELSFPVVLKPLRDFANNWFSAFRSLSRYKGHPEISRHKISARLYRTRNHANMYHVYGLRALRRRLNTEQANAL
jgi:hypothetical protein